MNNSAKLRSKIRTSLDKLEDLRCQRHLVSHQRRKKSLSLSEVKLSEGEFDVMFKRHVSEIEALLVEIARDSI